jgi:Mg/Co/Ni transporter MgtE
MKAELQDSEINIKHKLSALWVSLVLCYIYGDYFGLYVPGTLQGMLDGNMGPLGHTTQAVLLFTSVMMAIPSLMVTLSLLLKPVIARYLNILFGLLYSVIIILTMIDAWNFYIFFGIIEVMLSLLIVWSAWRWPKRSVFNG